MAIKRGIRRDLSILLSGALLAACLLSCAGTPAVSEQPIVFKVKPIDKAAFAAIMERNKKPTPPIASWHVTEPFSEVDLQCANSAMEEWYIISIEKGRIVASKRQLPLEPLWHGHSLPFLIKPDSDERDLNGHRYVHRVDNGYLIGFNQGEFGGAIWWFSGDGRERKKIIREKSKGFVEAKKGVFGIYGLAHMTTSRGGILKLEVDSSGEWSARKVAEFDKAPQAFLSENSGSILIVTTNSLVRYFTNGNQEALHRASHWSWIAPTSIVVDSVGVIYIGMRYFVARLTPSGKGYKEEWLVPELCERFEPAPLGRCKCVDPR